MNCPRQDGIPLYLKAPFGNFKYTDFCQGDIVTVGRTPGGGGDWRVVGIYKIITNQGDSDMAQSKDRVKFFLAPRYFQIKQTSNGMCRSTCIEILRRAFGPPPGPTVGNTWATEMAKHSGGFWITCRPSQFARFIVYRCDADECINGVKDLNPTLVDAESDLYEELGKQFSIPRSMVRDLALALGYADGDDGHAVQQQSIDVSGNFS